MFVLFYALLSVDKPVRNYGVQSYRKEEKELNTRYLPRSLRFCEMANCDITGSIDLNTLPSPLIALGLRRSRLSGDIYLIDLPEHLKFIDLSDNTIGLCVLEKLPASITGIYLNSRFTNALRSIDKDKIADDWRIHTSQQVLILDDYFEGW